MLLKEKTRDINEISKEAGVPAAQIEKFLQAMEQEGKIREKNGKYELMI